MQRQVMVKAFHIIDYLNSNQESNALKESPCDWFFKLMDHGIAEIPAGYKKEQLRVQIK